MDTALAKLRPFNLIAGLLHLASFVGILVLANDASLPVRATYLNGPPGSDAFGEPVTLFSINIAYAVAGFLLLSAFFHFLIISPWVFPRYTAGLRENRNTFRWVEYSMSSSIMIVLILQLNGIANVTALAGLFTVNAAMILFGWLQERYTTPGDGDLLPFIFGSMVGSVPWILIALNLIAPGNTSDVTVPGFVWGIIVSLFVFFNCFAVVQWLQYRAKGKWSNYLRGERTYIVLSLVAKTALAWQVFSGALAS
ncbi:heliorhodopsin HeR [Demequina sp. TTPB684]|uniref:heliorhodopsin HeR n=1 Tax=unclassified Demequina TaxID=2620311 RepID=UPI001CF5CC05|nr:MULTISPECIES: heliorhodopsin HeR [unclassified Demequina]MCB2413964.1 heliorhodopsin HeR [Demequina sp. TTPB684]UPU88683.1 heliorhodopsin HeR [Demequina sp. TMPB413]